MGLKIKSISLASLIMIGLATITYAAWEGPTEVVSGGWGTENGQFGINYGDSIDQFPNMIVISTTRRILIGDSINKRIQVFNSDGTFSNLITPKDLPASYAAVVQWPLNLFICGDSNIYTSVSEYAQRYSISGELQNFTTIKAGIVFIDQQCNFYTYNPSTKAYSLYSPTGQLIKTSTTRPLELGQVKLEKRSQLRYKITLTYPDKVYGLSSDREFVKYVRTSNDKVYGVNPGGAWRFNQCGKLEGFLLMPEGQQDEIPGQGPEEPQVYVHSEYGEPVVAPNGDIYTWNYTPDAYKILKWTWVDDPNVPTGPDAPSGLTVTPSTTGLYLAWTASAQDPGCVTGYEVARATTSGGVFSTVGTVDKGVIKYNDTSAEVGTMYYYKVRAKAGSEYSPYTAEVSGKR